jgi:hypothetical protein
MKSMIGLLATASIAAVLVGCGGNGSDGGGLIGIKNPRVRAVHAFTGAGAADVFIEGEQVMNDGVFGASSGYEIFENGNRDVAFRDANSQGVIAADSFLFEENKFYTVVGAGTLGNRTIIALTDGNETAGNGDAKFRVVNAASNANPVDVYITDPSVSSLSGVTPTFNNLEFGAGDSQYVQFAPDTYRIRVTPTTSQTPFIDTTVTLATDDIRTALVSQGSGASGLLVLQDGDQ